MTKAQQIRDLSAEELEATLDDKRKQLFQLVNEREESKRFEKPHRIRAMKKDIARLLTVQTERQLKTHQV